MDNDFQESLQEAQAGRFFNQVMLLRNLRVIVKECANSRQSPFQQMASIGKVATPFRRKEKTFIAARTTQQRLYFSKNDLPIPTSILPGRIQLHHSRDFSDRHPCRAAIARSSAGILGWR
ncbi:MAG: hypothetical protein KKG47_12665 [Proteobacteria bacterium]|nr:hypothetical protein [Pseudomonadota bacterium]MBU1738705.1 hypothetical protein [Pseudomonadota bacterium]